MSSKKKKTIMTIPLPPHEMLPESLPTPKTTKKQEDPFYIPPNERVHVPLPPRKMIPRSLPTPKTEPVLKNDSPQCPVKIKKTIT